MRLLKRLLLALFALIALLAIVGLALPRDHRAASRIVIRQPVDSVWSVVREPEALRAVWPELTRSERVPDREGLEAWEQEIDGFAMRLLIEASEPPHRLVTRIDTSEGGSFGGTWTYALEDADGGTRVTVTEEGWVSNPFFRVLMRLMGPHASMDAYLTALGRRFDEELLPEHLP